MAYIFYNPNPNGMKSNNGDCVIRAITKALHKSWDDVYWDLCEEGFQMGDWGNSNAVWDTYLRRNGFKRKVIQNYCPDCYTIRDFCQDNSKGKYILATGSHVVAVIDGNYYDSWDSGNEIPIFYYERRS